MVMQQLQTRGTSTGEFWEHLRQARNYIQWGSDIPNALQNLYSHYAADWFRQNHPILQSNKTEYNNEYQVLTNYTSYSKILVYIPGKKMQRKNKHQHQ
jgi:predicted YcjX-like family ATPase